jgi:hypothetical protein
MLAPAAAAAPRAWDLAAEASVAVVVAAAAVGGAGNRLNCETEIIRSTE